MANILLEISDSSLSEEDLTNLLEPSSTAPQDSVRRLVNFLNGLNQKVYPGGGALVNMDLGATYAVGTLTVATGGSANNEECTVANVTLTAKTSGAGENEFDISATAATQAANMVAAINESPDLVGIVTAALDGADVVITSAVPGLLGNAIELSAGDLANVTADPFSGGGYEQTYEFDLR